MYGYVRLCVYGYVSLWLTTLAIVGTGTSWPVREQDLAHRPKDTGNVGNRYRAAKDLVILPILVVIVVVKTGSKKRETNTATTYAITADVQWNPRIKLHMHFSALQWFVSPGDQSVGISLWDSPIFMWKFSATPESENWFTGKFTRNRACSPSNPLIQHDPTIHTVPEVCRTAAGTNVHLEPVLSACRPVAESAEAASSSRCFFKNMELQMFKVAPPAT